jgi:adenylosuccinate synthase
MRKVVLLSGRMCTGKSQLAKGLSDEFSYKIIQTGEYLKSEAAKRSTGFDRVNLQNLGDILDAETQHAWLFEYIKQVEKSINKDVSIVVDNIRNQKQLEYFRKHLRWEIVHVHLYAPTEVLEKRFASKYPIVSLSYEQANVLKSNEDISDFKNDADVRINTGRSDPEDNLVRVAARLNLYSPPDIKCVDVIVGGQFGSEGKGNVAAYLANEYDVLLRVGGPNAGHTVASPVGIYTYHQLPSGTRDTKAEILLGPGMTINVKKLLKEIKDCRISKKRLFIDPQAMIISDEDIHSETQMIEGIASTGQGGGAAAARKITGRAQNNVKLAKDIPELEDYVGLGPPYRGSTTARLERAYRKGLSVLLEGTQGSGLSLHHGAYPFVTSRDTNVAGCMAEAGISPSRIRRILLVIRYTPIRVANPDGENKSSGPLKHEVDFKLVAKEAGLVQAEVLQNEKTSTTKRDRRVGWFDWGLFRKACSLNAPTDIVITFVDYIDKVNEKARRFEQLTEDTIKFIEEVERVAQAPVSLISTRFPRNGEEKLDLRNIIDRRNWRVNLRH